MADRTETNRRRMTDLAGWAARAALVVGSVAMAVRVTMPRLQQQAARGEDVPPADDTGRGHPTTPASQQSLRTGHETEDMNAPTMWRVMATLAGAAAISVCLMLAFQSVVIPSRQHHQALVLTSEETSHPAPPPPNLQADPVSEIARLHMSEDQLLDRYARIDATHARIPIDRAMTLIVGHPLDTAP